MASAEQLLHEAHYAFHNISFGQTPGNARNASRAKSLCRRIIRKYPRSMEAGEAHAILKRLGEEAFTSNLARQHRHVSEDVHHRKSVTSTGTKRPHQVAKTESQYLAHTDIDINALDWAGLVEMLVRAPRYILAIVAFAGFFLFGLFGPFIFLPLIALVLLTGPFRQMLKPGQREEMNSFIARVNEFIAKQKPG